MRQLLKGVGFLLVAGFALTVLSAAVDQPVPVTPFMRQVEPTTAKIGDELTATGQALAKDKVSQLYLTNGKDDYKVSIVLSQTDTEIKFKVPAKVPAGRYALMVLTAKDAKLIEQPVSVLINE